MTTPTQESIKTALSQLRADVEAIEGTERGLLKLALQKLADAGYAIDAWFSVHVGLQAAAAHDAQSAADAAPLDPSTAA